MLAFAGVNRQRFGRDAVHLEVCWGYASWMRLMQHLQILCQLFSYQSQKPKDTNLGLFQQSYTRRRLSFDLQPYKAPVASAGDQ